MSPALQVLLAGVGTYLIRVSAIALGGRAARPSPATEATLRLIGPAVLAAIVADRLVLVDGAPTLRWSWLVAAAVAAIVAWRWRSAGITMAAGMESGLFVPETQYDCQYTWTRLPDQIRYYLRTPKAQRLPRTAVVPAGGLPVARGAAVIHLEPVYPELGQPSARHCQMCNRSMCSGRQQVARHQIGAGIEQLGPYPTKQGRPLVGAHRRRVPTADGGVDSLASGRLKRSNILGIAVQQINRVQQGLQHVGVAEDVGPDGCGHGVITSRPLTSRR